MGRGPGGAVVHRARLRRRRPELAVAYGRARPRRLPRHRGRLLRDQDQGIGPLRRSGNRRRARQATAASSTGGGVVGGPRAARHDPLRRRRHHRCAHRGRRVGVLGPPVPARLVPMPTQVGRVCRHRHVVADSRRDRAMAARADVGLGRLVRLDSAQLDDPEAAVPQSHPQPSRAHSNSPTMAAVAAATNT